MQHAHSRMAQLGKGISNGIPEGGVHLHPIDRESGVYSTGITGKHHHLFLLPSGMLVATEFDGAHIHTGDTSEWHEHVSGGWHAHTVMIGGEQFKTADDGYHYHETQSDGTLLSGIHDHWLQIGEEYVWSLTPQQSAMITGLGDDAPEQVKDVIAGMRKGYKDRNKKDDVSKHDAVMIRRSSGSELRTSEWTLKLDGNVRLTRGWSEGGQPMWAGTVAIMRASDDEVELWREDAGNRPERGGESIIVRQGESGVEVIRDATPGAFFGDDVDLPALVKDAVPIGARYWELAKDEADAAREWLVATDWWNNRTGLAKIEGDRLTNVALFAKTLLEDAEDCQSPMVEGSVVRKSGGRVLLHECTDEALIKSAIESGDYVVLATAGTGPAEKLARVASSLGKAFGYVADPRAAATLITTSCPTELILTTKVAAAVDVETEAIRAALVKAVENSADFGPLIADHVDGLLKATSWGTSDMGLAARAVLMAKLQFESASGSEENLTSTGAMTVGNVVEVSVPVQTPVELASVVDPIPADEPPESITKTYDFQVKGHKLVKAEDDSEERIVYGIVMEPDATDTQGDFQRAEVIRQAAYWYMEHHRHIGLQHKLMIDDGASVLESYIAPCDMDIDGQHIRKGTWLMAMRINNDDVWSGVKSGTITGFSIGGRGHREPV